MSVYVGSSPKPEAPVQVVDIELHERKGKRILNLLFRFPPPQKVVQKDLRSQPGKGMRISRSRREDLRSQPPPGKECG